MNLIHVKTIGPILKVLPPLERCFMRFYYILILCGGSRKQQLVTLQNH